MEPSPLDSALEPEIDKYHLVAELARGGMGIVHLASVQGPGAFQKLFVVKELKPELSQDEAYVSMFLDEARLAARLMHPNIVQTLEVGREGGRPFMVMEFLDGRSLHRAIRGFRQQGGLPLAAHLRVLCEMLLGLQYAHELKDFDGSHLQIVHRDVSPFNVFVTFDGQVKVIDFGIAKSTDSSLETKAGVLKGRVAYMAPEQAWGAKVDRRADIYSAGVMIWEAVAGKRLWQGMNEVQILAHLLREGPPPLRSVRPDCPPELDAICARAVAHKVEDRYSTAQALVEDLESHLSRRDDDVSIREVGALVAHAFADERGQMSAFLEETLSRRRGGPHSGVMPRLDYHFRGTSGLPATREETSQVSSSRSAPMPSAEMPSITVPPATSVAEPPPSSGRTPPWVSQRAQLVAFGAAVAFVAVATVGTLRPRSRPGGPPASAAALSPLPPRADAPGGHEVRELVDVVVRASPPGAELAIDGTAVTNPFHGRYTKDALLHHVTAWADGYERKTVDLAFTGDASVDVGLERRPAKAPNPAAAPSPLPARSAKKVPAAQPPPPPTPSPAEARPVATAPPPRPEISPTGGHASLRPISTSDPYGFQ